MSTLEFLAAGVGKPVSFFLEEDAVFSPNLAVIRKAREQWAAGAPEEALETLKAYRVGDEIFDPEYYLLFSLVCCRAAERAATAGKIPYAEALLTQSILAGEKTIYPTPRHKAMVLSAWLRREDPEEFTSRMETLEQELSGTWGDKLALLFARRSLLDGDNPEVRSILGKIPEESPEKALLLGESYLAERSYGPAAEAFLRAEQLLEVEDGDLRLVYERLETCFRELEDYKMAYYYAAKQK